MQELQNKFKINGQDYKFQTDTALDSASENPVENKVLFNIYRKFAQFADLNVASDMSNSDPESEAVPTVGAIEKNFARVDYRTRILKDYSCPNMINVFDNNPSGALTLSTRFVDSGNDFIGKTYYYVDTSKIGNVKYTYDKKDGEFKHVSLKLSPSTVYYVKYTNISTSTSNITSGFYYTNQDGVLQLTSDNKLQV